MSSIAENLFAAGVFVVGSMISCTQAIDRKVADGKHYWEHHNDPPAGSVRHPAVVAREARANEQAAAAAKDSQAARQVAKEQALIDLKRSARAASGATGAALAEAVAAQTAAANVLIGKEPDPPGLASVASKHRITPEPLVAQP